MQDQLRKLEKNIGYYYIIQFLMVAATTIPHAILTLLLLSKGILINQIAIIQLFYNVAVLIFELPSGIMADNFSRKNIFISSTICLFVAFSMILVFDSLYVLCMAWFIYGLSMALNTGTLDSDMINSIKAYKGSYYQRFYKNCSYISLLASILASGLGFVLYKRIGVNIYIVSLNLMIIAIVITIFLYKEFDIKTDKSINIEKLKEHISMALREINNNKIVKYTIISLSFLQIYMQFHFHYWQAIFLENGINSSYFYFIYLTFQMINILVFRINLEVFSFRKLKIIFSFEILILVYQIFNKSNIVYIISYFVVLLYFLLVSYLCNYLLNKNVLKERISSIVSFNSTVQRIVAALSLLVYSIILKFFNLKILYIAIAIMILVIEFVCINNILKVRSNKQS